MAKECSSLLDAGNARIRDDIPMFWIRPAATDSLDVAGMDVFTFLQGQVTCDTQALAAGQWRLGAHCNPKGRAQAAFLALPTGSADAPAASLVMPAGMAEPTLVQLRKYAMFSKVSLAATTASLAVVGGAAAAGWLIGRGITPPATQAFVQHDGLRIAAFDRDAALWLIWGSSSALDGWQASLPDTAVVAHDQAWQECLTLAGVALVHPDTQERFIPQELNYDHLGGISFRKGCYKGQEIIARLHFRGTPKFRARLFAGSGEPPAPGTTLSHGDASVGHVAQVAGSPDHMVVIAVVHTDLADDASVTTDSGLSLRPAAISCAIKTPDNH